VHELYVVFKTGGEGGECLHTEACALAKLDVEVTVARAVLVLEPPTI